MKKFIFTGDWSTSLLLEHFETYYQIEYSDKDSELVQKNGNRIQLNIADEYGDFNPDPKPEQINTINYFLNPLNQKKVISSLINYLNEVIYPYYKEEIFLEEEYPESYPEVSNLQDFQSFLKLNSISVYSVTKEDLAYCCLYFSVEILDQEHGLSIEMHGERCIDHGTNDGTDGHILAKELGLPANLSDMMFEAHKKIDNEKAIWHLPHPKYGKIKPWQADANQRFPYNAYRTKEDNLLINYVKEGHKPIEQFTYLYTQAKKDGRQKLITFFSTYKELN